MSYDIISHIRIPGKLSVAPLRRCSVAPHITSGFLRSGNFEWVRENREGQGKVREF